MADDTTADKKSKSTKGNCSGELKELPAEPGRAYNRYECQSCHQLVVVSHEDLELSGLPSEHSPTSVAEEKEE